MVDLTRKWDFHLQLFLYCEYLSRWKRETSFFILHRVWACDMFTFDVIDLCLCYMNMGACETFKIERTHSVIMWKIALLACTFSVHSFVLHTWTFFWRDRIKRCKATTVRMGLLEVPLRCPRETVWSKDRGGSVFTVWEFKSDLCNVKVTYLTMDINCSVCVFFGRND